MANESIGTIDCPFCSSVAEIRINTKEKLYYFCHDDGIVQPTKPNFQDYLKQNGTFKDDGNIQHDGGLEAVADKTKISRENEAVETQNKPKQAETKSKAKTAETKPEVEPEKVKKKSSILSGFMGALGSEE